MEQIKSILQKIEKIAGSGNNCSSIEQDLMLRYTRDLYEVLLHITPSPAEPALAPEPEPGPETFGDSGTKSGTRPGLTEQTLITPLADSEQQAPLTDVGSAEMTEPITTLSGKANFEPEPEFITGLNPVPENQVDFKVWNKDIRSYIGINDRYNFISALFRNNSEAYEEILDEINLCESQADALQFLENSGITTLYKWEREGFSEQIFYNALSQFFSSR